MRARSRGGLITGEQWGLFRVHHQLVRRQSGDDPDIGRVVSSEAIDESL
jgi:hypothetical protein